MALRIASEHLRILEDIASHCAISTGNVLQDMANQITLSAMSSSNDSSVQESLIARACGATHKGDKKLGADAMLDSEELEIKPNKNPKTQSSVNITDDTPSRLLKDMRSPGKKLAIGRCPGGKKFSWVVVCPMSDFAETRYRTFCKRWKHSACEWPTTLEEQIRLVEAIPPRPTGEYVRSSTLKFADVRNILGGWIHPEIDVGALKGKSAEEKLMQRISGK